MSRPQRALTLAVAALAGCGELDPEVGGLIAAQCIDEDSNPARDVSFSEDLQPLFEGVDGPPGCGCHFSDRRDPIGFQLTGLDLSTYATLRAGGATSGSSIVVPGRPCQSVLFLKTGPSPPFGSRMPFDGPPSLSREQRQLIADWIAEGARDN